MFTLPARSTKVHPLHPILPEVMQHLVSVQNWTIILAPAITQPHKRRVSVRDAPPFSFHIAESMLCFALFLAHTHKRALP